jgi:hypothetical protein
MSNEIRVHANRRRQAIDRLGALTTGAAVAGIVGTAGFGVLAAATWSGDPSASGAAGGTGAANTGTAGTTNHDQNPVPVVGQAAPQSQRGSTTQQSPRVRSGSGGGHASTGGSH